MKDAPIHCQSEANSLLEVLESQAEVQPGRLAFTFCRDDGGRTEITVGELAQQARAIAATLQRQTQPGDRALLVYSPGLEFISAFFGCLYAGVLAAPVSYPKPKRPMPRLAGVARNCTPTAVLSTSQTMSTLELARSAPELKSLPWIATDEIPAAEETSWRRPDVDRDSLAFLQYTSGSTSEPKGVMVSHGNLLHNLELIREGFGIERSVEEGSAGVFWLPAYHDMGLIGGILEPLYIGGHSVFMSPASFLQRPLRWLQMITEFQAIVSGAPNFAYDFCVKKIAPQQRRELDLSSWKIAFCGAEPIRAATFDRFAEAFGPCGFRADAFYPCYGLAEATLLVSGAKGPSAPRVKTVKRTSLAQHRADEVDAGHPDAQRLVGCGEALLGQTILIVDAETATPCADERVGEIWVSGPSVASGYWNENGENAKVFNARPQKQENGQNGDGQLSEQFRGQFLRTGDLGFLSDGQLFVTGRVKDVIIIRGCNHYPQDIEATTETSHEALSCSGGAAFSIEREGAERLVIVHEVDRQHRKADFKEVIRAVRREVACQHEVDVYSVVLIRQASLPRTTSGKVQRHFCRQRFLDENLKVIAEWKSTEKSTNGKPESPLNHADVKTINTNGQASPHGQANSNGQASPNGQANSNGQATPNGKASNGKASRNGQATPTNQSGSNGSVSRHLANGSPASSNGSHAPKIPAVPLEPEEVDRLAERIETWLLDWLVARVDVLQSELDRDKPLADYGLDSLNAVELSQELETWLGIKLTPVLAWNHPTTATLARYLAGEVGRASAGEAPSDLVEKDGSSLDADTASSDADFAKLLGEIENLSDDEAESALN